MRYLREEKLEELKAKLVQLKSRRLIVAELIKEAVQYGDLPENSEYDYATAMKDDLESEIAQLEKIIAESRIIRVFDSEEVSIGVKVTLEVFGAEKSFFIADPIESEPENGIISIESPIGSAALGRRVGDEFVVSTPRGEVVYKIKNIQKADSF